MCPRFIRDRVGFLVFRGEIGVEPMFLGEGVLVEQTHKVISASKSRNRPCELSCTHVFRGIVFLLILRSCAHEAFQVVTQGDPAQKE